MPVTFEPVTFKILRQTDPAAVPQLQTYQLDIDPRSTILDALTRLKWEQDGSLAFRKNCRNTICGSCALRINGRAGLACQQHIDTALAGREAIAIGPLGNLPVVRDLIVDMQRFWDHLGDIKPYLKALPAPTSGEFRQDPSVRDALGPMGNCILCAACFSDCNAAEVNPQFVGPHALAKANRHRLDDRDSRNVPAALDSTAGVWGCTRCHTCNDVCPMEVAPLDQITALKREILAQAPAPSQASRAIRHRQTMVSLVAQDGWIDERKFGLQVVSNGLRDLQGLLSIVPLGLRLLAHRKFPLTFEASAGAAAVREVIENVQAMQIHPSQAQQP